MKIHEVRDRVPVVNELLAVWKASVRATHSFLSDAEILQIKEYVPQALREVERLIAAEWDNGRIAAFMGVNGRRLEMLFITPEERGKGIGRRLIEYGIENYGIRTVTVNEQNPQAVGFYRHLGFEEYKRTERDEEGNPYPLLYMRLSDCL